MVLGAGFTGLAAARQLALHHPDDEVILVEAQEVGFGASGRNSGFAIDLPHDIGAADYIGDLPTARMNLKLNLRAQAILRGLITQHGIDCQIRPDGKYQAAVEDKGLAVLEAYRTGLEKLGQPYQMIDARDLPEHFGTGFYRKALYTPGTQLLQPAALAKGLAESLPANVTLHERTTITHIEQGRRITLKHSNGEIVADQLLLTNNAFASYFGFLAGRLLPIFTYASMTRPLTEDEQARLGGKASWGIIPADPFGSTLRRTPDQRLLVRNSFSFNADGRANPATSPAPGASIAGRSNGASRCCRACRSNSPGAARCACHATTCRTSAPWRPTYTRPCAAMAWALPVAQPRAPCWLTG